MKATVRVKRVEQREYVVQVEEDSFTKLARTARKLIDQGEASEGLITLVVSDRVTSIVVEDEDAIT